MARSIRNSRLTAAALMAGLLLAGSEATEAGAVLPGGSVGGERESQPKAPPVFQLPPPGDFVQVVDNPYSPFIRGTVWVYAGQTDKGQERIVVTVLRRTRLIEGIRTTVVKDIVKREGELIEATYDWYAQDRAGNVWYLGEDTKEYRHGRVVSTEGSWEAGVDGASAGVVMFARPEVGVAYRQEYYRGHAEDQATALTLSTQVTTSFGYFGHVRLTEDTTALDPTADELKFYAPGVGVVQELDLSPDFARTELISMHGPSGRAL